jgi:hypothetical protein
MENGFSKLKSQYLLVWWCWYHVGEPRERGKAHTQKNNIFQVYIDKCYYLWNSHQLYVNFHSLFLFLLYGMTELVKSKLSRPNWRPWVPLFEYFLKFSKSRPKLRRIKKKKLKMHGEFIYRNILFFSFKKDVACVHDKMNFFYPFFFLLSKI